MSASAETAQPDESAQSVHSTPSKARPKSEKYTKESMDDDLGEDVLKYTCTGIPFNDFLKLAFNLTEEEHAKLLNDVEVWAVHNNEEYKAELRKFVAHKEERQLYSPFVNMGNMILKRAEFERNVANERRIKLLQVEKEKMPGGYADRKPDVVLAPDNAYGKKDMDKVDAARRKAERKRKHEASAGAKDAVEAVEATSAILDTGDADANDVSGAQSKDVIEADSSVKGKSKDRGGLTQVRVNWLSTLLPFEFKQKVNSTSEKEDEEGVGNGGRSEEIGSADTSRSGKTSKGKGRKRPAEDEADEEYSSGKRSSASSSKRGRGSSSKLGTGSSSKRGTSSSSRQPTGKASNSGRPRKSSAIKIPPLSTDGDQGSSGGPSNNGMPPNDVYMNTPASEGPSEVVMRSSAYRVHMPGATMEPPASVNIPKAPKTPHSVRVQLASYVAEVFSTRGDRKFAFAVLVEGNEITLFFYHRSAIIQADPFDIASNPTYFALLLLMFYRDLPDLGFNEIMGYCNPFDFTDESTNKLQSGLLEPVKGSDTPLDISKIVLGEKLASPYCLIGRGTSVIKANINGYKLAIKFSWQVKTRKNEDEFILDARTLLDIIKYIPEIFGKAVVNDMTPVAKLRDACMKKGEIFEVREFRALVMREYFPIYILGPKDFWSVIVKIARCLHTLFVRLKMLHGDISIGNIAFYRNDKNEIIAVLLDFDLASYSPFKQSSNHRTGTAPFMARGVLDLSNKEFTRALHHDLESLFYAVVWQGVGYKNYEIPKKGDILAEWRKGPWGKILGAKELFMRKRDLMKRILDCIEDEDLRIHCQGIGYCFRRAMRKVIAQEDRDEENWLELSFAERKLAENAVADIPAPLVTYAEWMKGAGEDPSCTCCQQTGDTQ